MDTCAVIAYVTYSVGHDRSGRASELFHPDVYRQLTSQAGLMSYLGHQAGHYAFCDPRIVIVESKVGQTVLAQP